MVAKVFIDGEAGTTGLQISERLAGRRDVVLLHLPEARRKNPAARAEALNSVDLAILCLPDEAAREAVSLIENPDVKVVDASTAHRVAPDWVYGFPEMEPGHAARIAAAKRVSNVGCYATGSIALIRPLVMAGLLPADHPVSINAISGYTGGGRQLIAACEDPASPRFIKSQYWLYALGLEHKHLPEIQTHGLLAERPIMVPSVGRYAQGMIVQVPLHLKTLPGSPAPYDLYEALRAHYGKGGFVTVADPAEIPDIERLDPEALNGSNEMRLYVFGNERRGQAVLVALLDNLGKGASGSAVQNMNLMLGLEEGAGLAAKQAA